MKELFKKILLMIIAVLIITLAAWILYWLITSFSSYVREIPKELGTSLVAGVTAIIVVMVGRYYERKRELDALYRDKKMEIYAEFLKKFFELFSTNSEINTPTNPDKLVQFLRDFMRNLLLWSGPEPIKAFLELKRHLNENTPNAQTLFITEKFLLALRSDLRHSNRGIPKGFWAEITLKESKLFLEIAKKNPNVTLEELSEIENLLKKDSRD